MDFSWHKIYWTLSVLKSGLNNYQTLIALEKCVSPRNHNHYTKTRKIDGLDSDSVTIFESHLQF